MTNKNMFDEGFELAALIFRLAGYYEYSFTVNDYQKEIVETFKEFANHEAVKYISGFPGMGSVFKFAIHIEKKDGKFVFIDNISFPLSKRWGDKWSETKTRGFLPLFNKFYVDTKYAEFYNSHIPYFEEITQKFVDETYGSIDFDWFGKYVDPSNLRCIYSTSSTPLNFGTWVNDKIFYCMVSDNGIAITHEYCHNFGDPIAVKWYEENLEFKKLCDDSVNMEKMAVYGEGKIMACEYVTRAYEVLYKVQHGGDLEEALLQEKNHQFVNSFPYIEEVYQMILALEKR